MLLFSYDRHVTVDRSRRSVAIVTRRFWVRRQTCVYAFEQIDRIILRAQELPGFGLWGFVTLGMSPSASAAFFLIALGLTEGKDEFVLFSIWKTELGDPAWLEHLTSTSAGDDGPSDAEADEVVRMLQQYLRVPVSSH